MLRTFIVLFMAAVALVSGACRPGRRSKPVIRVSKATTHIVEPLDAAGYVDYVAALNQAESKGVKVENNFEVVVRELLGSTEIPESDRPEYFRLLGLQVPTSVQPAFKSFGDSHTPADAEEKSKFDAESELITTQPWSTKEHPRGAEWLQAAEPFLNRLVEGTRRPRYYSPYLSELGTSQIRRLNLEVHPFMNQRELARCLIIRAYSRVHAGDLAGAWSHAQAIHRMARLFSQRALLIDRLVAFAIERSATDLEVAIVRSPQLSAAQCRQFLASLLSLAPLPTAVDACDTGERLFMLDIVQCFARGRGTEWSLVGASSERTAPLEDADQIDWSTVLEKLNADRDAFVAAYRDTNPITRGKKLADLASRRARAQELFQKTDSWKNVVLHGSPQERGEQFSTLLMGDESAIDSHVHRADVRINARQALIEIRYALELYRLQQGRYPQSVSDLSPEILKAVPLDPDSGKPPIYRPQGPAGFVLYSVGENQKDDGGKMKKTPDDPESWDDIAIEAPPDLAR